MQKIAILIIGTNRPILEVIARLINQNELWEPTISYTLNQALANCMIKEYKLF